MSIEIKNVSKKYGSVQALDNVSVTFEENKIYGLLGRNGAGKTTLLKIIADRIFADSGAVFVDGEPGHLNDNALGKMFLTSEANLYPEDMRVGAALRWTKTFYPDFDTEYAANLCDTFGLKPKKKIKALSTGYSSIFKLIVALSVNTPYVLFDEPILGLDANNRDTFYHLLIEKFSNSPFTAIISTHLIEEISSVIDHIVIIKDGKIIRDESRDNLLSNGYTVSGPAQAVDSYIENKSILGYDCLGGLKTAYISGKPDENIPDGLEISGLDLQKLFIQLTNS